MQHQLARSARARGQEPGQVQLRPECLAPQIARDRPQSDRADHELERPGYARFDHIGPVLNPRLQHRNPGRREPQRGPLDQNPAEPELVHPIPSFPLPWLGEQRGSQPSPLVPSLTLAGGSNEGGCRAPLVPFLTLAGGSNEGGCRAPLVPSLTLAGGSNEGGCPAPLVPFLSPPCSHPHTDTGTATGAAAAVGSEAALRASSFSTILIIGDGPVCAVFIPTVRCRSTASL
jgi:hypothetical protein